MVLYNYPVNLLYKLKQYVKIQSIGLKKKISSVTSHILYVRRTKGNKQVIFYTKVQFDFFVWKTNRHDINTGEKKLNGPLVTNNQVEGYRSLF